MDPGRRRELEALLRGHLAEQPDHGLSRLRWLADQLENYVERWIGSGEAMLDGDLFAMVEIGADLTHEEIRRAPRLPGMQGAWDEFSEVLSGARTGTQMPAQLREPLTRFRATLLHEGKG
ncbi:MAG TPA: hypothetical protein VF647_25395 [Longimicrobium sp.]|jgi:hypothetical protein